MKNSILVILIFCICSSLFAQNKRLALVIGNAEYKNGASLKNPVNDANLMASTLENLGFDVMKYVNVSKSSMEKAMYDFSMKLKDYKVALFYYAGHGILVDGVNYLVPTDAILQEKLSTRFEAVDIAKLISQFNEYQNNINIVILDACRYNPYRSWSRGAERGFKPIAAPSGTFIAYATGMGAGAADGEGQNGLYTSKLVEQMNISQRIEDVFIQTRVAVREASQNAQNPQEWSQLTGSFYFKNTEASIVRTNPIMGRSEALSLYGNISLSAELGGDLYLDGQHIGTINANEILPINHISVGFHDLEIDGATNWKNRIYVRKNESINVSASPSSEKMVYKDELKYKVEMGVSVAKLLDTNYTVLELLEVGVPIKEFYGVKYKGGRIFNINTNDGSGLIAALNDQKEGTGVSWKEARDTAINLETEGYDDWYLPSKDELNLLYLNLRRNNEGNLTNNIYWSATEGQRTTVAWRQDFNKGYQYENYTYLLYSVRSIRAF